MARHRLRERTPNGSKALSGDAVNAILFVHRPGSASMGDADCVHGLGAFELDKYASSLGGASSAIAHRRKTPPPGLRTYHNLRALLRGSVEWGWRIATV